MRSIGFILLVRWLEDLWRDLHDLVTVPVIVILITRLRRRGGGVLSLIWWPFSLLGNLLFRLGFTLLNLEVSQFYFQHIRSHLTMNEVYKKEWDNCTQPRVVIKCSSWK